jgi:rubredoxin
VRDHPYERDVCDLCVHVDDAEQGDDDEDGIGDTCDLCPDSEADLPQMDGSRRLA